MAQWQLYHQVLTKFSRNMQPWSSLHNFQAAQQVWKSPLVKSPSWLIKLGGGEELSESVRFQRLS